MFDYEDMKNFKKHTNFFPTPNFIAYEMAQWVNLSRDCKVCEPSAGMGNLIKALQKTHNNRFPITIEFYEQYREFNEMLSKEGYTSKGFDFLENTIVYDQYIMNPPYRNGADKKHVEHAYNHLSQGGNAVALVSTKTKDYFVEEYMGHLLEIKEYKRAFKDTNITTWLIVLNKPLY